MEKIPAMRWEFPVKGTNRREMGEKDPREKRPTHTIFLADVATLRKNRENMKYNGSYVDRGKS